MAMEVPELFQALISQLQLAWPEADEDAYGRASGHLETYSKLTGDDTYAAHQHIQRLLSSGRGEAMDALGRHWNKVKDPHAAAIETAALNSAAATATISAKVQGAKLQVLSITANLAKLTFASSVAGSVTFGASTDAVGPAVAAARTQTHAIVSACLEDTVHLLGRLEKDPSVTALDAAAADLAAGVGGRGGEASDGSGTGRAWGNSLDPAGSGRAIAEGISVDHAEHQLAAGKLREVATAVLGTTAGALSQAAGEHATAAAGGSLGAALAPVLDSVLDRLAKATAAFGDHLNGSLPDAVLLISSSQQDTDDDNKRRMSELDR
ncbi:hypothetical protein OG357_17020 [Streptomyces sp. NBC_01255]|uniref:hypothetical protein n=1 Tax=Streptomyces sp. NBC_01255 TaxID=2903798 RepID=UPI002E2FE25C|nr:hypothetical protein [Streptomyces sp. NBC_01255]